jgi:hypothetical protein
MFYTWNVPLSKLMTQFLRAITNKRPKNKDADEWLKLCAFLRKVELDAQDRGEAGLFILYQSHSNGSPSH